MLCCILNYAPHYRMPIYRKLAMEINAHFYFGDRLRDDSVEKIDLKLLPGFQKELKVIFYSFPLKWEWVSDMIKIAINKRYDKFLITTNIMAPNLWLFIFICKILGKKVYSWEHGISTEKTRPTILWMHKLFHRTLTGSFIYGNKAKNLMIKMGYDGHKLHTIYNSLNYDLTCKYRAQLLDEPIYIDYYRNFDPVLLFIGRLTKSKELNLLVEAHELLIHNEIASNVAIIGDGEVINELQQLVNRKGLTDRYWFIGALYEEWEIARYLFNASICISPGSVGLTAIHAMSYGLPVITNDNFYTQGPEHEIIIENITGLFFKQGDSRSLAEKIEYWLKNHLNRNAVRAQCFKPIDNTYNPDNQTKIFKKVLC